MADLTNSVEKPVLGGVPQLKAERIGDLRIATAGYVPAKDHWIGHRFSVYAVGLVVSGRGSYQVDQLPAQAVGPGSVFAVFPGPLFTYGPEAGTTWEEYYIGVVGEGIRRWIDVGWFFTDGQVHHLVNAAPIIEQFRRLLRVIARGGVGDADRAVVLGEQLLLEMYYSRSSVQEAHAATAPMEAVLAYCQEALAEEIDFQALARHHQMSYSSLRRQFRRLTGCGPAQYLTRLRCDAARMLLSDTNLPLKQIARQVGMADAYTFSRTFKRSVGISPQYYRQQTAPWSRSAGA